MLWCDPACPHPRGSQYNMQYVGARMHGVWVCWGVGGAAELATSAEFRQVKNYRLTFRLAKSEVGSRAVCSVSCVNGPAPPPGNSPEMIKSWPTEGKYDLKKLVNRGFSPLGGRASKRNQGKVAFLFHLADTGTARADTNKWQFACIRNEGTAFQEFFIRSGCCAIFVCHRRCRDRHRWCSSRIVAVGSDVTSKSSGSTFARK